MREGRQSSMGKNGYALKFCLNYTVRHDVTISFIILSNSAISKLIETLHMENGQLLGFGAYI